MSTPSGPEQPNPGGWEAPTGGQWGSPTTQSQWGSAPPAEPDTNGKAITALILGIGGFVVCPVVLSIAAIVLGSQARNEIRASQGRQKGEGLAKAGVILGIVGLVLTALFIVAILAFGLAASDTEGIDIEESGPADPVNVITFVSDAVGALGGLL